MPSSYAIGARFEAFINDQSKQDGYASASEAVRNGLRVLEEREEFRETKLDVLRTALQQGINSGPGIPADEVFARLEAKHRQMAGERSDV